MLDVFGAENLILLVLSWLLLAVKVFGLVTAIAFSGEAYRAAGKLTKPAWVAILAVGAVLQILFAPFNLINLALTIAAFVYLADVRPALAGLRRR